MTVLSSHARQVLPYAVEPPTDRIQTNDEAAKRLRHVATAAGVAAPAAIMDSAYRYKGILDTNGALAAEDDEGSVEYKWKLTNISSSRLEHLKTQMKFRVAEGSGQCLYEIGVADDGVPRGLNESDFAESVATVRGMAESLGFDVQVVYERTVAVEPVLLRCAELRVTKQLSVSDVKDLRVCMCGNTGSGKSTLVSVLVHGVLDDGSGHTRQGVFNHKHEITTGRTSSVSHRTLGFDETGRITNYDDVATSARGGVTQWRNLTEAENTTRTIAERSVKLVTLMDLGGDRRYSKTALFGMTSRMPGFACVCVGVDRVQDDVEQYSALCRAMRIPFFVVITKSDTVSELELDDALFELSNSLEQSHQMGTLRVESSDEVELAVTGLSGCIQESIAASPSQPVPPTLSPVAVSRQQVVPVFTVSCVDGTGIPLLKQLFRQLPVPAPPATSCSDTSVEVLLDRTQQVPGVGVVLCGTIVKGSVKCGDVLALGPNSNGAFYPVRITSMHVKGSHVVSAPTGLEVAIAAQLADGKGDTQLGSVFDLHRKGYILVDCDTVPNVCREFEMHVEMLTNTEAATVHQEPIVHCRNIRQAARILSVMPDPLGYKATGLMRCRFLYNAEVLGIGSIVLLRWGQHAKIMGVVTAVMPMTPTTSPARDSASMP